MHRHVQTAYALCLVAALAVPFGVQNGTLGFFIDLFTMPLFIFTIPLDLALETWIQEKRMRWGAVLLSLGLAGTAFSWVGFATAQALHLSHAAFIISLVARALSFPSTLVLGPYIGIFSWFVLPSFNLAVPLIPVGAYMMWDHRRPRAQPAVARTPAT